MLVVDSLLNTWSISESFQYHLCNKPSCFVLNCKWFRGTIVDDNKFSCFAYQPKKMSYIFSCALYSDIMTQRIPCMYSCQYLSLSEMEALLFTSTIKMPACLCCPFSCFLVHSELPFSCLLPPGPSVLLEFVTFGISEGHQDLSLVWQDQIAPQPLNYETLQT